MADPLRVLHVTRSLDTGAGGVARYVTRLAAHAHHADIRATIATTQPGPAAETDLSEATLVAEPPSLARDLGHSRKLSRCLPALIAEAEVVHLHGLRTLLNRRTRALADRLCKPLVVSPHGQLEPWTLHQRRVRKWLTDRLWVRHTLDRAAVIHAVSDTEAANIRRLMPRQPLSVVPIGIDPPDITPAGAQDHLNRHLPALADKRLLIFCSLWVPRKGLWPLAEAWGRLAAHYPDWHLVLAGADPWHYRPAVERAFHQAGANHQTTFLGQIDEPTRQSLLNAGQLLVLPTENEAFGIIIGEALAAATPVLTTHAAPWPALTTENCGWRIAHGADALKAGLQQAMSLTDRDRAAMGRRGQTLVHHTCHWPRIAHQMRDLYQLALSPV
jgi:glycosyltransferase involved in cell wall biosynthesis